MALATAKVPLALVVGLVCLALGAVGGAAVMAYVDSQYLMMNPDTRIGGRLANEADGGLPPGGMKGMPGGPGMGKGGFGGKGKGKGKGAFTPSSKGQLAQLVAKLDVLTDRPLTLKLTQQQRDKLFEQLQDLPDKKELSDDEAKNRLDAALEVLKGQHDVLKAAGFRLPGEAAPLLRDAENPFVEEENRKHLQSLVDRLRPKKV